MAPRKDASDAQQALGIDSFDLPKALVTRLAKSALPAEAKLQKDTVTALVRSATVFINYLSATAQDVSAARSRRTIASEDVLAALEVLALGDLVPLLRRELDGYRGEKEGKNKGSKDVKGKSKEVPRDASTTGDAPEPEDSSGEDDDDDAPEDDEDELEPEPQQEEDNAEDLPPEEEEERAEDDGASETDMPDAEVPPDGEQVEGEIEDTAALEAEELRRDARGLEERTVGVEGGEIDS